MTVRVKMLRDYWMQRDGAGNKLRWRAGSEYPVSDEMARTMTNENPPAAVALDILPSTPHRVAKAVGGSPENKMMEPTGNKARRRGKRGKRG